MAGQVEYEGEPIGQLGQDGVSHELVYGFERHKPGNGVGTEPLQ